MVLALSGLIMAPHRQEDPMRARRALFALTVAAAALTVTTASSVEAQGNGKKRYAVTTDRALSATRIVLQRQGYEIVRVATSSDAQVVYYRRGNRGRGKGQGPMERMVIRTVERRIVFEEAPSAILVDLDFELKL
jgi:hypothetical protein